MQVWYKTVDDRDRAGQQTHLPSATGLAIKNNREASMSKCLIAHWSGLLTEDEAMVHGKAGDNGYDCESRASIVKDSASEREARLAANRQRDNLCVSLHACNQLSIWRAQSARAVLHMGSKWMGLCHYA